MREHQLNLFGIDESKHARKSRPAMILPIDTLILLTIVLGLLLIVTFSLGVERGRKITYNKIKQQQTDTLHAYTTKDNPLPLAASVNEEQIDSPDNQINGGAEEAIAKDSAEIAAADKDSWDENKYLIQVATYLKEHTAQKEAKKLEDNGYPVVISKKGKFVVIFVGEFKDKSEANKSMESLKKKYKDCFIRRL